MNEDITADIQKRVTFYVNRMYHDGLINDKTRQYLIQTDVKPGHFYILPKIHKPGNPGRPIVSSNSHPTERISQFMANNFIQHGRRACESRRFLDLNFKTLCIKLEGKVWKFPLPR